MVCTFFGHSDTPDKVKSSLDLVLIDLIENKGVKSFYVGNNGCFDDMVINRLERLSKVYDISFFIVLAYMPTKKTAQQNTLLPEGIECCPARYRISFRNKWMIKKTDYVVTYVNRSFGGAYKFKNIAINQKKTVIELSQA